MPKKKKEEEKIKDWEEEPEVRENDTWVINKETLKAAIAKLMKKVIEDLNEEKVKFWEQAADWIDQEYDGPDKQDDTQIVS